MLVSEAIGGKWAPYRPPKCFGSNPSPQDKVENDCRTCRWRQDCLVVGYDSDGDLFVRSSRMDRKLALWLAEQLRLYALQ